MFYLRGYKCVYMGQELAAGLASQPSGLLKQGAEHVGW